MQFHSFDCAVTKHRWWFYFNMAYFIFKNVSLDSRVIAYSVVTQNTRLSLQFWSSFFWSYSLCEMSLNTEFFLAVFSRIQTEYGEILPICPYLVRMRENTDQNKLHGWALFTQWFIFKESLFLAIGNITKVRGILNISKSGKYF